MSPEAAVLGLLSAVRATPLAVVYSLLLAREPGRLLSGYLAAGLVVSLVTGIAVVTRFDGTAASSESSTTRLVVDLVLGIAAVCYAVGYGSGRLGRRPPDRPRSVRPVLPGGLGERLRHPTTPIAALAGAATNLPGLFYVAALVAILETEPGPASGVLQVAAYNALRFAVPIAALVLVVLRPDRTRAVTGAVHAWGLRHRRGLITGVFGGVGVYLAVKGLAGLLG